MINYFNFKKFDSNHFLLTNDFGKHVLLDNDVFKEFILMGEVSNFQVRQKLKDGGFIYDSSMKAFVDNNAHVMRDAKDYLFHPTQLHIFVVTSVCNMKCIYCQAQHGHIRPKGFMSKETAKHAVDIALQSPARHLQFEFQGGEPLMNFDTIKFIVEYAKSVCNGKNIVFSLVTNLTLITDEMLEFIIENDISISTSLDGDALLHNENRPYSNGEGTFDDVYRLIKKVKTAGVPMGALMTTTKHSLERWREIVDTYVELGFDGVSLRPLTPLGYAHDSWNTIGYTADEFVDFYTNAFNYILEINERQRFSEGMASIFLRKILEGYGINYMELRSPCGAALGQIAYYYDGDIYTCDEGRMLSEMGDKSFRIGNVYESDYNALMNCDVCRIVCSASTIEALPSCFECVYQPYCGVCPVVNYALDNDLYEKAPGNYRCKINSGILDVIFNALVNRHDSNDTFWRWLK